uniref:HAMP domain-containing protein n=1 Tax=Thermosporothrix sp. COM3 TaxID=2490863 RepID=A0A455SBP1_9CHLR|nr:hypothetical protein KTC_06340 [Thermosporothrix sp. COM3]
MSSNNPISFNESGQALYRTSGLDMLNVQPLAQGPVSQIDNAEDETNIFHGEALARDLWGERYGTWIVFCFITGFAFFLILMNLIGQTPGRSFFLKSTSDILQFTGEAIGLFFCLRITFRLYRLTRLLKHDLQQKEGWKHSPNEVASARADYQAARRSFFAWTFLAIAVAVYASGQAIWTSYDVRMDSSAVPYPGVYDIGFVLSYPFFLTGTILLTRRNKAAVGRVRLLLDALAVIGAALALSWFFQLEPAIAGLSQAPSPGAAFLSVYFPTGDLFLVAVGAFLMFSPLSNREQQPVFLRLCLGLFCLAITDSLMGFYSITTGFNTGTIQDILWPLSMSLVGLAAIEYPRSIAHEQGQDALNSSRLVASQITLRRRYSPLVATIQAISPFVLALFTCALLLLYVAPKGGNKLVLACIIALTLILIVIIRQALTLIENNRLTMQIRGELVISRRELQVTKREADEATRTAQEKRVLEEGIGILREVHARVARGDFSARAPTVPGPLLPIAISLNLMLDRLSAMSERGMRYDRLARDSREIQKALERIVQGQPAWTLDQPPPQSTSELRPIITGLIHLQRLLENQQRRQTSNLETMGNLLRRFRDSLYEVRRSPLFDQNGHASFERMLLDRMIRELDLLFQQQHSLLPKQAGRPGPMDTAPMRPFELETSSNGGGKQRVTSGSLLPDQQGGGSFTLYDHFRQFKKPSAE